MKAVRSLTVLTAVALLLMSAWVGWRLAAPDDLAEARTSATITISQPDGVDDVVGEGDDFATTVLGDPWDMSQPTDILPITDLPGVAVSGGVLSYKAPTSLFGGIPLLLAAGSEIDAGKIGVRFPIDAGRYRWLSFRMRQPSGTGIRINWEKDRTYTPDGYTLDISVTSSNWQTYVIDLGTYPKGSGSWTGSIVGLYLQSIAAPGTQISIDWVRLTVTHPASNSLRVAWSGLSPARSNVDFYVDSDATGCDGALIHTESSANVSGSFDWGNSAGDKAQPSHVAPGSYYVCALVGGTFTGRSLGRLMINQAPIVRITQPGFTSGDDYATDAGNAWDMSDAPDFPYVLNGTGSLEGGVAVITAPPQQGTSDDIQVYLNMPNWAAIDTSRYYYLTYRMKVDYPYLYYTDQGQFSRVFWGRDPFTEAQSKLIYVFPDWQTYTVDLRSIALSFGPSWTATNWNLLRIDPIANDSTGQNVTIHLDDVKLTGDERADFYADIQWQLTDSDTSATTMELYYDADRSGFNGTPITTRSLANGQPSDAMPLPQSGSRASPNSVDALAPRAFLPMVARNWHPPCTGACYTWYTGDIAAGTYYLYACVDDSYNRACRYSDTPLIVSHP